MKYFQRKAAHRHRRGFTLIELIVVIMILAVLAMLIVPRIVGRTSEARIAKAQSDLSTISTMLQTFRLDVGRFPSTEEGLNALMAQPPEAFGWRGPYSSRDLPLDPWGSEYVYEYPGPDGEDSFVVASLGADGAIGGEGEAEDLTQIGR